VRALFLYEDDEVQIAWNFRQRFGHEQLQRARIAWLVSRWLRTEAHSLDLPTIPARPWETVLDRAISAIDDLPG
jgi:hypothetical protein